MNLLTKSVAAGVTLALASISAQAQITTAPAINEGSAPSSNGLYLAVWDNSTKVSEIVNLSTATTYNYTQITAASGALTPTAANSAFALATNPAGSGQVLQLNFGQVAGFTSTGGSVFGGSGLANESYMVLSGRTGTGGGMTYTDASTPTITATSLATAQSNIGSEIASWVAAAPTTGDLIDNPAAASYNSTYDVVNGVLQAGAVVAGSNFGQSVGSAVDFYNTVSTGRTTVTNTQYANANGAGFWFLSSTGDLTYNIATSGTAPVPLPAAFWLLGSGLLGMAGIARRRAAG
jgi:hypothetical protein